MMRRGLQYSLSLLLVFLSACGTELSSTLPTEREPQSERPPSPETPSLPGISQFLVVSDFDDTIKISHSESVVPTVLRAIFTRRVYTGAPELYRAMDVVSDNVILSNGTTLLRKKINTTLDYHRIPRKQLILRNWLKTSSKKHKLEALEKLAASTTDRFVLLGDDTEHDPEFYDEFARRHPERVHAVLIHRVRYRAIPDAQLSYFTLFDAAYEQVRLGVISAVQAIAVGEAVLGGKASRVFPSFAHCPTYDEIEEAHPERSTHAQLEEMRSRVAMRVQQICSGAAGTRDE